MAAADASGTIVTPRFDVTNFVAEFSNFKLEGLQLELRGGRPEGLESPSSTSREKAA